jgi:nicotinamidase-related amidase
MHSTQMSAADTGLLVIDVQEKLLPFIVDKERLVRNIAFLIDGARLVQLLVQATEQYPKGLGSTVAELAERLPERPEKVAFSCCAVPSIADNFRRAGRNKIVLAGIESHVCVQQTALDLLAQDFRVYIPVDAVSARYPLDHEFALRRLEKAGAILTTAETCLFEWLGGSNHPQVKQASKMVQERMKQLSSEEHAR